MRKTLFLLLFALLAFSGVYGQGTEDFTNSAATDAYLDGSFVGATGLTWNYFHSRDEGVYPITDSGIMLRRASDSKLQSGAIPGGVGDFSFQYRKAFTGTSVRQLEVYVNGVLAGTTPEFGTLTGEETTVYTYTLTGLNIVGNFDVMIKNVGTTTTNRQTVIDNISWTGYTGGSTPVINALESLTSFNAVTGTPSDIQSYTLSGSNLSANIIVDAPDGYEISTDQTTWTNGLNLASSFNGLVYIRLTGTTAGTYNGNITHNSTGATEVLIGIDGLVADPVPTILPISTMAAFTTIVGSPSVAQQYTLTAAYLTTNIEIVAPAGFEISSDGSTFSSTLSLANNYTGQVYVRLTGTTIGDYNGNITHNSTGAAEVLVAVSGSVLDSVVPTTFLEENFVYTAGTTLVSNGWIAHSFAGTNSPVVASEGLVYPGYPAALGLAGQTTNTGEDVHKNFTPQTTGTVYNSFLIKVTSATETGDYVYHYSTNVNTTTDFKAKFFVGKDAANNVRFGLTKAANLGTAVAWTGYDYALNTTYLVVLKYEIVNGATNDLASAWINPVISATEPAAQLTALATEADIGTLGLGAVGIRQSNVALTAVFDGIRVTNDWSLLWSGEAPPDPVINVTGTLSTLYCIVGNPSEELQSYTLAGENLTGPITITAPAGFQVSTSQTEGWASQIQVASSFSGTIWVRMFATEVGVAAGNITHTSPGATQVDLAVDGEAFPPSVVWNVNQALTPFTTVAGTPSANQFYTLSATNATTDILVSVEAPFELSTTGTENWLSSLTLLSTFNGSIYIRMNPVTAGDYNGTILHVTSDATDLMIPVSGTATPPAGNYAADLFFSEYVEGLSNNKALEIFNGTGAPVDLSNYTVKLGSNGTVWGNTYTAPTGTMLAHGDVWVIANSSAIPAILGVSDVTSTVTYFNGDDALGLFHGENQIDAIGTYPSVTGVYWAVAGTTGATLNHTLIRKPTVTQGNLDWALSAGTNADDSEWSVQAIDYITDLGVHTFAPGMEVVATPVISPASGVYSTPQTVTITCATAEASIYYTTNGTEPTDSSTLYTTGIPVSATTTVKAKAYKTGFTASSVATATYTYPTNVANLAALRALTPGTGEVYRVSGEAILTFQQSTSRHPKYVQDATAAIVIDDPSAIITTTYNLYDGITGLVGTIALYNSLLQFTPVADPGAATSSGNTVVPAVRTLATITTDDQAKLLKVMNVTIDATLVNFPAAASNINLTDASGTGVLRTFASTDYVDSAIPTVPTDIICLGGQFGTTMQISPRFLSDMTPSAAGLDAPVVTITTDGNSTTLSWDAIAGAVNYRIEGSNDPYGTFTPITTTAGLTWSGAVTNMKFFRVIAIQ